MLPLFALGMPYRNNIRNSVRLDFILGDEFNTNWTFEAKKYYNLTMIIIVYPWNQTQKID